jgi:hypothetical protein
VAHWTPRGWLAVDTTRLAGTSRTAVVLSCSVRCCSARSACWAALSSSCACAAPAAAPPEIDYHYRQADQD